MLQSYPAEIEVQMQNYYQSLSEKDRRRYAGIEAVKLGYGGQVYIRRLDEKVKWTNLKRHEIGLLLKEEGIQVRVTVVAQLLKKHNFRKRKAVKTLATGESEHRNEQFETIEQLKETYQGAGNAAAIAHAITFSSKTYRHWSMS